MVTATEIAGRACPWCSSASEVQGHDHRHVSLRSEAGGEGGLQASVVKEGEHSRRRRAVRRLRARRSIAGVVPLEVGRNLLRVGTDREHESDARNDDCGDEDPRESERIEAEIVGPCVGSGDQDRSAQGPNERTAQHVPKPLSALTRWVHVGSRDPQLIAGAHPRTEDEDADQKQNERPEQHSQASDERTG